MFHSLLIVGLVPCYPDCRFFPTFAHRGSPYTPRVAPRAPIPLVEFISPLLLLPPRPPFPWAPPTVYARRCLLSCASSSCHVTMNRSAVSRTPRYHFPAFLVVVGHSAVSTPNTKGECPFHPSVARSFLGSSTMHLCQILKRFARSRALPTSHRPEHYLGNRSLLCRAMAPAKKSRRLRLVISTLS